jgi:hypothetical protein
MGHTRQKVGDPVAVEPATKEVATTYLFVVLIVQMELLEKARPLLNLGCEVKDRSYWTHQSTENAPKKH